MRNKDTIILEQAYQTILEASGTYDGNRLASDAKHFSKAHTGEGPQRMTGPEDYDFLKHKNPTPFEGSEEDESLSDPVLQKGMAILNQYAQGDITNKEAALMFKDLYEKGVNSGPSQDDMYYTTLNPRG